MRRKMTNCIVFNVCCGPMGLFDDTCSECIGELYLQLLGGSKYSHFTTNSWTIEIILSHSLNKQRNSVSLGVGISVIKC